MCGFRKPLSRDWIVKMERIDKSSLLLGFSGEDFCLTAGDCDW